MTKIHLIHLGCAKNLVDTENMAGLLEKAGMQIVSDPEQADICVVNTCSFIESAVNESIDTILSIARLKQTGSLKRLIVAGCLPERYRNDIESSLPEVDQFIGTGAFDSIIDAVQGTLCQPACFLPDPNASQLYPADDIRKISTPYLAYIKIAEGCHRTCTYCIIPKLRGKHRSRPVESIVYEAAGLIAQGTREIILVAQDTTSYGRDLESEVNLAMLLEQLARIDKNVWIRFLYGHPDKIDSKLIKTVAQFSNICSYFDIPVQHASFGILKKMGRPYRKKNLKELFDFVRSEIPNASLRTTVIVGFPGETEADFNTLLSFVKETQFDHLGAFVYSDSDDLPSHLLSNHVTAKVAKKRYNAIMKAQMNISINQNKKHLGNIYDVLVEQEAQENVYIGRTFFQAPETDGITFINAQSLTPGHFIRVRINDTLEYDLVGEPHDRP